MKSLQGYLPSDQTILTATLRISHKLTQGKAQVSDLPGFKKQTAPFVSNNLWQGSIATGHHGCSSHHGLGRR